MDIPIWPLLNITDLEPYAVTLETRVRVKADDGLYHLGTVRHTINDALMRDQWRDAFPEFCRQVHCIQLFRTAQDFPIDMSQEDEGKRVKKLFNI